MPESEGEAILIAAVRELAVEKLTLVLNLEVDRSHLDGPDAAKLPTGGGRFIDEVVLNLVSGLEPGDKGLQKAIEAVVFALAFEQHEFRGREAVLAGVLRRALLSLFCLGST
jgi:hypothetical protein